MRGQTVRSSTLFRECCYGLNRSPESLQTLYSGGMLQPTDKPISARPFEDVFKTIVEHASAQMVYGEPISLQGKTVLPVAKVRYGFRWWWWWEKRRPARWRWRRWTRRHACRFCRGHGNADPIRSDKDERGRHRCPWYRLHFRIGSVETVELSRNATREPSVHGLPIIAGTPETGYREFS